ncbi:MAG: tetratricopeptide repeat protein [Gammaproteobacteria bacterium]|nr:MAG: tetratricopeptide repeat protein [Gammaproteobacteria bacterium]UCH38857.1 MAG: tetratricopeptide repeat protein [Gammaproteobacteria bacterium]
MKKILIVVPCVVALTLVSPTNAENTAIIVETNSHNVFTGLFRTVWAHFRSLNPSQKESARSEILYTAGIRGAESTDTLLQPYWKGDLSQDRQFQAELQNFDLAQAKLDQGDLEAAARLFDDFLQQFEQSALRPNALFGKGISLAGSGKNEQSLSAIRQFVEENPRHPLVKDARLVIDELR